MGIEAVLEQLVCEHAVKRGWKHRKLAWPGRRNAPDHFFGKKWVGHFLVEFKQPGERPRPGQEREIAFLRECGVTVHVIDNLVDGYGLFD